MNQLKSLNKHVQWMVCGLDSDKDIKLSVAKQILSEDEIERANRFHFDKHRERFIRGRAYMRIKVAEQLNIESKKLVLDKNEFGKPFVTDNPIYFNLSHSSATAVLVLSEINPIGIDIEFVNRKTEVLELGPTVFTDSEMARLETTSSTKCTQQFFNFWTAKESYLKMLGSGLSLEPKKLQLKFDSERPISCHSEGYISAKLRYVQLPDEKVICCIAEPT